MEIFIIIKLLHIFLFFNFYLLDFLQKSKNDQRFVCFLSTLKSHVLLSWVHEIWKSKDAIK